MSERQLEIAAAFLFDKRATVGSVAAKFNISHQLASETLSLFVDTKAIRKQRQEQAYKHIHFLASIGWSGVRIAKEYNYDPSTIHWVLRKRGKGKAA